MKPQELIEIEAKMAPGPWENQDRSALIRCVSAESSACLQSVVAVDGPRWQENAQGICSARNRLKDLAELWAWAEPAFKDLKSNHGAACAAHSDSECDCWLAPLQEILTRLRGD